MDSTEKFNNLQTTIKLNPKNFQARRELIMMCLDLGFEKVALAHIKYLLDIFPKDANLYFNMGICYEMLRDDKKALEAYKKAVEIEPDEPDFLYNLALLYEKSGNIDEAMTSLKKVIYFKNEDANAFFSIGILYSKKNDSKTAIKCFKKAIEYNYSDYFAHFYLACEYKKNKEYDFALMEYRKVIELSGDYYWAYYNTAQIYWELGRVADAIAMLKNLLGKNPKDTGTITLLAKIYIKQKEIDEAMMLLTSAMQANKNGDIYYLAARVFEMQNEKEQYKNCLELALDNKDSLTYNEKAVRAELEQLNESSSTKVK